MSREELGWDEGFAVQVTEQDAVARVIEEQRGFYFLDDGSGEPPRLAEISGRMRHEAKGRASFPAVGDWVVATRGGGGNTIIERILNRRTKLSRKAAGTENEEQILCTNVDVAFVVTSLDGELHPRRLERYLAAVMAGGVRAVVVLTKVDLVEEEDLRVATTEVIEAARGVDVILVSAPLGIGFDEVAARLPRGRSAVLLGSSGVGKSTLINGIVGSVVCKVGEVRAKDGKGRHKTTARTLVRLPGGGLIIDTPGMREIEAWDAEVGVDATFIELDKIAAGCRFSDCSHESEPGCAVRAAMDGGQLLEERYEAYLILKDEARAQVERSTARVRAEQTRREKVATRAVRWRVSEKKE